MEFSKPITLSKPWARVGAIVVPDDSKIDRGWIVEQPAHQIDNWLENRQDTSIAHINQRGIPEWDSITLYLTGKSWVQGSNGTIYYCKVGNSGVNPVTDVSETYWRKVLDGNLVITSPEVSPYMKTLLDDTNANSARTTLGFSSLGISIVSSGTAPAVRSLLFAGANGDQLFTSPSAANSRAVIGVVSASDTQEGLVQRATDPETVSGINDTKFITPKKLKLGFSINLGSNGHIAFPTWLGGLIINWGSATYTASQSQNVTMSKPFLNVCLQGFTNIISTSTDGSGGMFVSYSGINMRVTNPENSNRSFSWLAIGY